MMSWYIFTYADNSGDEQQNERCDVHKDDSH